MTNTTKKIINYSPGSGIRIRLRGKRLTNGNISLYLDYYEGYSRSNDGVLKTHRKTEYLKIYLIDKPRTQAEKNTNKENLQLAQSIRSQKESDISHGEAGLTSPHKRRTNFFDYCQNYILRYKKGDIRMIRGAERLFKEFTQKDFITPKEIDKKLIKEFVEFLLEKYNGETPHSYFARFKKILNAATEDGLFNQTPAIGVSCPKPDDGIIKEILMPEEIKKMAVTECGNPEIKRAFLLSLNTGLRFVDIKDLKFKNIQNDCIVKRQQKTGKTVYINLNSNALMLLGKPMKQEDNVFNLPSFESCLRTIKNWAKKAGVNKNITWHSARHSFATILMMNNTDIRTVSGLMGHSKLEHTQKYTHIVNELKSKAVNSLPEI